MRGSAAPRLPRSTGSTGRSGAWFADERGVERRLKVTWHPERRMFVLSVWHRDTCTATFRLPLGEVPRLVRALVEGLGGAASTAATGAAPGPRRRWPHRR
ncbi:MAG: hypothetical protein ACLGI2_00510 [Acidimicrobiia bacterium]